MKLPQNLRNVALRIHENQLFSSVRHGIRDAALCCKKLNSKTEPPGWFLQAIQTPYESRVIEVEGCPIHYLRWGEAGKPGLLLIHGNGAHSHWWDFIAPFFLDHYAVAAIDLSGMGDSGHRAHYSVEVFVQEAIQVCRDAGFADKPILVGHSFGGYISLKAGTLFGEHLTGVVLVDSPVRPPDYEWERDPKRSPIRPKRIYESFEQAKARFRLVPTQECDNDFILEHIADQSLVPVDGGWTWKFDDQLFKRFKIGDLSKDLSSVVCRIGVVYGENSLLFSQDIVDYMFQVLDSSVPFVSIPEAHHHLILDQPLAFIAALRTLLAEWRHSKPQRKILS